MKNLFITAALCTSLVACGETPKDETSSKAAAPYTLNTAALSDHIKTLSSDEFGGRAPGTPGEELTVNYITKAFKEAGLSPANGDSFTQNVPLVSIEAKGAPTLAIAGGNEALSFAFKTDHVIWTRKEAESAAIADSELVFVGYGINAPERDWNDYDGIDVKGKTVVILVNDPGYATQDDAIFNGNSMTYYGRWTYKFEEAARQGAAGALIIHDTKPAAYPWTTVEHSWTGPQFDIVRADKGANLLSIEGWLTIDTATAIFDAAGLDRAALSKGAETADFKAISLNLTASASLENEINHVTSRNVAGVIKGAKAADEYFIYMAHWDHLGTDPSIEGDGIFNGAHDNATGTAGLIELAKQYASGPRPDRSVLFLAVTAEEQGLLGSAYYAANPLVPLKQTVGGINMDGLNLYGPTNDITVVGLGNSELDDVLTMAANDQKRVLVGDYTPEKGYFYRSDHFELSKLGVPMLYPNAGYDHKEKGRDYVLEISQHYIANDYHTPSDEFNPDWDLTGAVEDLNLFSNTGRLVINSTDWPNWKEGTEFKARRDAQMAAK